MNNIRTLNFTTDYRFARFAAVNHSYGDDRLTAKNTETDEVDGNPPITAREHDLLTPFN